MDALLEFKTEFLIDLNDPKTKSWVDKTDCCSWDGITCDAKSGKVIRLDLSSSHLQGHLKSNSSLFRLRHLRDLNLAGNNFTSSPIPAEFDKLVGQERLDLSDSSFSGQIPINLLQLTKLVSLDLSSSYFSLSIDESFLPLLARNLRNLRELDMSFVNISSEIPHEFSNMRSLRSLDLSYCHLFGEFAIENKNYNKVSPVDLNVFSPLKNLQLLYLSGLPLSTTNITSDSDFLLLLKYLYLIGCNITEVPEFIRYGKNLRGIYLSNNKIKGQVPDRLWRLPELFSVDLSNNSLSGFNGSLKASLQSQLSELDISQMLSKDHSSSRPSLSYIFGVLRITSLVRYLDHYVDKALYRLYICQTTISMAQFLGV